MRTLVISTFTVGLLFAAPAAAQDTTIVIKNDVCTVKVDDKQLSEKDTKAACARMKISMEKLRVETGKLQGEMGILRERLLDQSHMIQLETKNLGDVQGNVFEFRTKEMPELMLRLEKQQGELEQLRNLELPKVTARLRDESGRLRVLDLTSRSLATLAARPRFGITIDTRARETDSYGAYVSAVTPGGPADKAGIQSADIIMKVGKESVSKPAGEETPGVRLIAIIGKLEVGKPVDVELRRKNDTKKVKVTPETDNNFFAGTISAGGTPEGFTVQGSPGPAWRTERPNIARFMESAPSTVGSAQFGRDPMATGSYRFDMTSGSIAFGALGGIEMVSLNADLGSYFGTAEGVLILSVGRNEALGLKAGDVVLSVDGRKVTSPSAMTRIIGSYEKGDSFKLQVMRQKKNETVTSKM